MKLGDIEQILKDSENVEVFEVEYEGDDFVYFYVAVSSSQKVSKVARSLFPGRDKVFVDTVKINGELITYSNIYFYIEQTDNNKDMGVYVKIYPSKEAKKRLEGEPEKMNFFDHLRVWF